MSELTAGDRITLGCMVVNILDDTPLPDEPEIMQRVCKGHAGQSTWVGKY
jgi:hypothetical protein